MDAPRRDPWLDAQCRGRRAAASASSPSGASALRHDPDGFWVGRGRRRARRLRDRRPARARLVPRRAPRPPGLPVARARRRDHPARPGGGTPGEPADGRRRRPQSRLERALRPVRDVPRDAAARGRRAAPWSSDPGSSRPGAAGAGRPRRHRPRRRSTSPAPRTTSSGARCPALHAFTVVRDGRTGRLRLRPGRRRDRPDRGPRPGRPRATPSRPRSASPPSSARRRPGSASRASPARRSRGLLARGWRYGDGVTLVLTLRAVGPLGSLRDIRRGRPPVIDIVLRNARAPTTGPAARRSSATSAIDDGRIVSVGEPVADGTAARGPRPRRVRRRPGLHRPAHPFGRLAAQRPGLPQRDRAGHHDAGRRPVRVLGRRRCRPRASRA